MASSFRLNRSEELTLTDYRERTLKDVITQIEPGLFKKVTGLNVKDFEVLVSLDVFNSALMNDAVYKFKRYEDASLSYAGINKHDSDEIGLRASYPGVDGVDFGRSARFGLRFLGPHPSGLFQDSHGGSGLFRCF